MHFFLPLNSFLSFSLRATALNTLLVVFVFLRSLAAYRYLITKEFREKFRYFVFAWLFSFLRAFINADQLYSLELGELLEDNVMLRDPQQFVFLLYSQSIFWAFYLSLPLVFYAILSYWYSALTASHLLFLKLALFNLCLSQLLSLFFVYRWIFPEWIVALSLSEEGIKPHIFEPDRFQIYSAFFEEIFNVFCFTLVRATSMLFSRRNSFLSLWNQNRMLLFFMLFIFTWVILGQMRLGRFQAFAFFLVFNFRGFMFFLGAYLNAFKLAFNFN